MGLNSGLVFSSRNRPAMPLTIAVIKIGNRHMDKKAM